MTKRNGLGSTFATTHCHHWQRLGLFAALLIMLLATGIWQWQQGARVQSNILAMLPKVDEQPLTQAAIKRVESQLEDRVYFALIAANETQAVAAGKQFITDLTKLGGFIDIKSAAMDDASALNKFYFPHRFKLLTDEQLAQFEQHGMAAWLNHAQQQIYSAFGYANSALLANDPLLLYPDNLKQLAPQSQLQINNGILLSPTDDKQIAAIVSAKGSQSAFNPQAQTKQLTSIEAAKSRLPADIKVIAAGALFHASHATSQAKAEVSTLGLASLIGVIALAYLAFRSIMPLLIAATTLTVSFVSAFVVTLTLFGEIHLLTLVFGTSLIGVAIDYCFHFYCERLNQNSALPQQAIKAILPAISLALVTTLLAYIAIGLTPFPGMQQVASFCGAGLLSAYLTLVLAYPTLAASRLPNRDKPLKQAQQYLSWIKHTAARLSIAQRQGLALLAVIAIALPLSQLTSNDDIRALQTVNPQVMAQEQQVRHLLSGGTDNQFILVSGANEQQLLRHLDQLEPVLSQAQTQGWLGNYVNLGRFIPSHQRQDNNYLNQQVVYQQLADILDTLGLNQALASELQQQYRNAKSQYIEPDAFFASSAGQMLAPLWITPSAEHPQEYGAIVLLGGIRDLPALSQSLTQVNAAILVDKVADISTVMGHYRQLTLLLLAIALTIAAALFCIRFGIKNGLLVVAVPLLAILTTLSVLALVNAPLTLFHALALILVFGIGVDYGLFFAASSHKNSVMMAVTLSACSTMLAFGLLAFSQTPAIHAFGFTLLLGIAFAFVLSPLPYIFARNMK
ncbi:MMPL family transporter [Shewanella waksmanii]|uniref:MMPL family transporter n=1 Tax=Shewanella waksmanii TaxID=213783 RepID=UPI003734DF9C